MARSALRLAVLLLALGGCCASRGPRAPADPEAVFARKREAMVAKQIEARGVRDPAVLKAMREVPRHRFVRPEDRAFAYDDHPVEIGHGQTISQPYIVAFMTEALALRPGDRVLEIGTGSGYQAAVLATIVKDVYTIEIVPELAQRAAETLRALGFANVHVRAGDGYLGWPAAAPFDAVMVTAAPPRVPQPLLDQLAEGGRLVVPLEERGAQHLVLLTKRAGRIERRALLPVRFVPMTGKVRDR